MFLRASLAILFASFASFATCQSPHDDVVGTRAELMRSLSTKSLKVGAPIFLRTTALRQTPACTIPENTTVAGEVTSLDHPAGTHRLSFAVRFEPLHCSTGEGPELVPVLIAMQGHPAFEDSALKRLATAGLESQTMAGMFSPSRPGVPTSADTMLTSSNALSVTNAGPLQGDASGLKTGEVAGLRGVSLQLPSKTSETTITCGHDRTFESHETTFVLLLVPKAAHAAEPVKTVAAGRTSAPSTNAERAETEEETEICAAGGCTQVATPAADVGQKAAWTLSLGELGFQPRPDQLLSSLAESASVHFLGDDQLLLTFTLHTLTKRSAAQQFLAANPRKVRAVLLSRDTGRVLRVEDWTVPSDLGPYVWNLNGQRVLAEVGADLVVFGPGLVPEQRLPLSGALAFLTVAPGGEQMLLATVHEKHAEAEHRAMARYLGPDQPIDEDYDLIAADGNLHVLGSKRLYSQPVRPALLRSSMVTAEQGKLNHWQVMSTTWAGQRSVLARAQSSCPLQITSFAGDLVLLRGCTPNQAASRWYRVLNAKGATVLKGSLSYFDLLEGVSSDAQGALLALATAHFLEPFSFTPQKRVADFNNLQLNVVSTTTGKTAFAAHLPTGTAERQAVSLSPSGASLAVLTGNTLRLFPVTP